MRIVHAADIHLGYRAYAETSRAGVNQREADVAVVFHRMVSQWIRIRPDVVVIAGDFFDKPRPSNPAIVHAMKELRRVLCPVILVAGNHDKPKSADVGSILPLFSTLGNVTVVDGAATWLEIANDVALLAVPDGAPATLEPSPDHATNILVLHGGLEDVIPHDAGHSRDRLTAADLHADRWSYVALGDYHVARDFGPNCGYSGAMEYTSSNIWGELREERTAFGSAGKSFVEYDTVTRQRTRHAIEPARLVVDLPVIDAAGMTADALTHQIVANGAGTERAVARQMVLNCSAELKAGIDQRTVSRIRAAATHYRLDIRKPQETRRSLFDRSSGRPGKTLDELVAERLGAVFGEDHDAAELGMEYYRQAGADEAALVPTPNEGD